MGSCTINQFITVSCQALIGGNDTKHYHTDTWKLMEYEVDLNCMHAWWMIDGWGGGDFFDKIWLQHDKLINGRPMGPTILLEVLKKTTIYKDTWKLGDLPLIDG